jgi:hypothetical protein
MPSWIERRSLAARMILAFLPTAAAARSKAANCRTGV